MPSQLILMAKVSFPVLHMRTLRFAEVSDSPRAHSRGRWHLQHPNEVHMSHSLTHTHTQHTHTQHTHTQHTHTHTLTHTHRDGGHQLTPVGAYVLCLVAQYCLTLYNPMDCIPPGSSVHRILQARILEWVSLPSSKGSL